MVIHRWRRRGRLAIADPSVIAKLESGELNFAAIDILSNFVKELVLKELAAEFCGRSKGRSCKDVVPLFENAEQNGNYLRLNAQRSLRRWEEFGERPEERKGRRA